MVWKEQPWRALPEVFFRNNQKGGFVNNKKYKKKPAVRKLYLGLEGQQTLNKCKEMAAGFSLVKINEAHNSATITDVPQQMRRRRR